MSSLVSGLAQGRLGMRRVDRGTVIAALALDQKHLGFAKTLRQSCPSSDMAARRMTIGRAASLLCCSGAMSNFSIASRIASSGAAYR
jgi:hypothetical protein